MHNLLSPSGTVLAQYKLDDEGGQPVAAHFQPSGPLAEVVAQAQTHLGGMRLDTPSEALAEAFGAAGLPAHRVGLEMRVELTAEPQLRDLPDGWALAQPGWDDDLAVALKSAYGVEHPDGVWRDEDTVQVAALYAAGVPVEPLIAAASARAVGPDGRSVGHVLTTKEDSGAACIINLAVAPHAQGRGLGPALLAHALRGAYRDGSTVVELGVAEQNPARRMYEAAGFAVFEKRFSIRIPAR